MDDLRHTVDVRLLALGFAAVLALSACGSNDDSALNTSKSTSSSPTTAASLPASASPSATSPVARTSRLDAIAVIGHSGATGYNSPGTGGDERANSWATGTNPKVASIYQRLLATHPALEIHA